MSNGEVLSSLREAVFRATGLTMKPSETYHVARSLIDAGWTLPATEENR